MVIYIYLRPTRREQTKWTLLHPDFMQGLAQVKQDFTSSSSLCWPPFPWTSQIGQMEISPASLFWLPSLPGRSLQNKLGFPRALPITLVVHQGAKATEMHFQLSKWEMYLFGIRLTSCRTFLPMCPTQHTLPYSPTMSQIPFSPTHRKIQQNYVQCLVLVALAITLK